MDYNAPQNPYQVPPTIPNMPPVKENLPNSTAVLVLGICSIVFFCIGVGGILGIIGIVLGAKAKKIYNANPTRYDGYGNLNAGFIMSIIGTVLGSIYLLYYLIVVIILGSAGLFSNFPVK